MKNQATAANRLSEDEMVLYAHLQMKGLSRKSALTFMKRTDLTPNEASACINAVFKTSDRFFTAMAEKVHMLREEGKLPDVTATKRPLAKRPPSLIFRNH